MTIKVDLKKKREHNPAIRSSVQISGFPFWSKGTVQKEHAAEDPVIPTPEEMVK